MAWVDSGDGRWIDDPTLGPGGPKPTAPPPSATSTGPRVGAPTGNPFVNGTPAPEDQFRAPGPSEADVRAQLDPASSSYAGPGYSFNPRWREAGQPQLVLSDPLAQESWKSGQQLGPPPEVPGLPQTTPSGPPAPAAPALTPMQRLRALEASAPAYRGLGGTGAVPSGARTATAGTSGIPDRFGRLGVDVSEYGTGAAAAAPQPGDPAPDVDRSRIDPLLRNVSAATSGLMGLAQIEQQSSRAEAQLRDAAARASQAALGQARGGNRRDRAFLERQALAEGQFNTQQVGRDTALLRAQEEVDKNNLRLAAYKAAGDLGLNAGALELDVERIDLESATNWINNEFENHRLGLQLDQQEAERVANFARDMALIEQQYYAMSVEERQHIRDDLTRKYGISEQTKAALAQVDASNDWNWNTFASGLVGGATSGITAGILK